MKLFLLDLYNLENTSHYLILVFIALRPCKYNVVIFKEVQN